MAHSTLRKPGSVGDILLNEYLDPLNLTINSLSKMLNVHRNSVSALIHGRKKLTTEMAFRLSTAFDNSVYFWLNLQQAVDAWEITNDARMQEELSRITTASTILENRREHHQKVA